MTKCPECRHENIEGTPLCRECGARLPEPSAVQPAADMSSDDAEVRELLRDGKKIEAIKRYRERHGVGLKEAKDAVEALEAGRQPAAAAVASPEGDADVLDLMRGSKKIQAIKVYRERYGVGLKDAKDAVEALAAQHGITSKGSGCAGVVLLGFVGLAVGAWCLLP